MKSRRQLQILGISLIVMVLQAAACTPAPAPPPAPVTTAPAVSTPAPANPAAAPVPTAAPTVAPTAVPTKPAVVALPTPVSPTPTVAAAPLAPQQVSFNFTDCGTDLGCFIEASRTGALAKVDYTMAVDFLGLFISNTDTLAIGGRDGDRLLFSQKTLEVEAGVTEAMMEAAQDRGMSDADIKKAISTAMGVAELVESSRGYLDADKEKDLDEYRDGQQARVGTGKECKFPQPALTAMLEQWQKGQYSTSDWDMAECTDITAAAAPSGTPAPTAAGTPPTEAELVPAELSDVPIPSGFIFVKGSVKFETQGSSYRVQSSWFGQTEGEEIFNFYREALLQGWRSHGGVVNVGLNASFSKNDTDPPVRLYVHSEPSNGGTILTLTITNGET